MTNTPRVSLHRLIVSLSKAFDRVDPNVMDHQVRTTSIALAVGAQLGMKDQELLALFNAAVLHDIGIFGLENRLKALNLGQLESVARHSEAGYLLLRDNPLFAGAAELVRHHHAQWDEGRGELFEGRPIPLGSHVISLADVVERQVQRGGHVLTQSRNITDKIRELRGRKLHPQCVDAFLDVATRESFWLEVVDPDLTHLMHDRIDWPIVTLDEGSLGPIAEIFARAVDAASPWTAVHSAGVAASAAAIGARCGFANREVELLKVAGYLHDLGKLSVPTAVLDKPGRLNAEEAAIIRGHSYHTFRILESIGEMRHLSEWAGYHHERVDGGGYPFRLPGKELSLGSRIMVAADIFTALGEDRPYRRGMSRLETLTLLHEFVKDGGLDRDVAGILEENFNDVDEIRRTEQTQYAVKQQLLVEPPKTS